MNGSEATGLKQRGSRLRVLYVEDDAALRRTAKRVLDRHGVEVVAAKNLAAAAEAIHAAPFDAAVLDLQLPDGDGATLLPLLHGRGVPAIVVSGAYDAQRATELIGWNTLGMTKPVAFGALAGMLRQVVDRRAHRDGQFARQEGLTACEVEVIACAARGLTDPQIAEETHRAHSTIREHWQRVFVKLGIRDRRRAVALYRRFVEL